MKHWRIEDVAWDRFDPARAEPGLGPAGEGRRHGGAERHRLRHLPQPRVRRRSGLPPGRRLLGRGGGAARRRARQMGDARRPVLGLCRPPSPATRPATSLPLDAEASIRGSRTGELIARCMVETGTSSYYTALAEATQRAGAAADLPPHRRRRVPPLQAVLRPHAPLPGAREHRPAAPPAHRRRPHHRKRGRRTGLRLALRQRAGRSWRTSMAAAPPPTWPAPWRSTASATSSAAWA